MLQSFAKICESKMSAKQIEESQKEKRCFVIMPISDMEGYDEGHFLRVYNHLIKPACLKAGFTPIRADDVVSSNYIVVDILSKIIESDIVICDLSGRNPNVLYELGIRQAFSLPAVLIKDFKTNKIFDIQGLRYIEYNQGLRIDSVEKEIDDIAKSIQETEKSKGKDINSLIQLLGVKPATLPSKVELSGETSVILSAVKDLADRITSLEAVKNGKVINIRPTRLSKVNKIVELADGSFELNNERVKIGDPLFIDFVEIGKLAHITSEGIYISSEEGAKFYSVFDKDFSKISIFPF